MSKTKNIKLHILDESEFHVTVFKPYNMVVVPGRGTPSPCLLDLVQAKISKNMLPVHRIDRVTAGCVVFAKNKFAEQAITNAFSKNLVAKTYLAIVSAGSKNISKLENKFTISEKLYRVDTPNAKRGSLAHQTVDNERGKTAITNVKVLKRSDKFALLEIKPQTGRMHQIRVHLSHAGFPIIGDKLYKSEEKFKKNSIALFAQKISVLLPKNLKSEITASTPTLFTKFIEENF